MTRDCGLRIADCGLARERQRGPIQNPKSKIQNRIWLLALFAFAALAASCSLDPRKDLVLDPANEFIRERAEPKDPIILIPGTLGSRLFNVKNGEVAWGNLKSLISPLEDDLDLPIDGPRLSDNRDNLKAYRVLDLAEVLKPEGSGEVRYYADIIDFLTLTLG